jgi:hypothetical protein
MADTEDSPKHLNEQITFQIHGSPLDRRKARITLMGTIPRSDGAETIVLGEAQGAVDCQRHSST